MSLPLDLLEYYQSGSASKNRSDNWTQIISLTQKNRWFFSSVCSVFFRRNPIKFWNLTCLFKQKIGGILLSGECFLISKNEMSFWGWGRSRDICMWEIFTHNNLHIATIRKTYRSFSTHDAEFYARILLSYSKSFWYHECTSKITLNYTQFLQFSGRISSMKKCAPGF